MKKVMLAVIFVLANLANSANANILVDTFDKFSHVIFKAGWPTAEYKDYEIFDVNSDEKFIIVQMNGVSFFSDQKLNMRIKVLFTDSYGIKDVDVIKHNALLMAPFGTLQGLAKIIEESNNSSSSPAPSYAYGSVSNNSSGSRKVNISVNNKCHKAINIAVRYLNLNDDWVTDGWWELSANKEVYLVGDHGRLVTGNANIYYFAESTDDTYIWKGTDNSKIYRGRTLGMIEHSDTSGEHNLSLSC